MEALMGLDKNSFERCGSGYTKESQNKAHNLIPRGSYKVKEVPWEPDESWGEIMWCL